MIILSLRLASPLFSYRIGHEYGQYWMALQKDDPTAQPKTSGWYWLDGQPNSTIATLDLWASSSNEPSGVPDENCARLKASDNSWWDIACRYQFNYICKRKYECVSYLTTLDSFHTCSVDFFLSSSYSISS